MPASWAPDELQVVVQQDAPNRLALMLYGSVARGSAHAESDVDLLELVTEEPAAYRFGRVNVTQYLPSHLQVLASQGSLFVLHLRADGIVVSDDFGILRHSLEAYSPPSDYHHVWDQLAFAAGILDPAASNIQDHVAGLARLGIYVLRTAIYLQTVERGEPDFDSERIASLSADEELQHALAIRRRLDTVQVPDVELLYRVLRRTLPACQGNSFPSVEAYMVAHADRGDLDPLFAAVLSGSGPIGYSALSLPPF